jgi:signal transduction histidine kinase/HAMP domain-containing protein
MKKRGSLRTDFIIAIVLAVVLLASALVVIMNYSMLSVTDTTLSETMRPLAQTTALSVRASLHMMADRIFIVKDNPILADPVAPVEQKRQVLEIAESGIEFVWLGLYSADGYLEIGNPYSPPEIRYRYNELFTLMNETLNPVIDDVHVFYKNEREVLEIVIGCPIVVDDKITRFLVGSYMYDVLSDLIGYINISSGSQAYIVNKDGIYIAHRDISKVRFGETMLKDNHGVPGVEDVLEKMNRREIGAVRVRMKHDWKIFSFAPIRGTYWTLVIETPREDFLPVIRRNILTGMYLALFLLGVFLISANVFVARRVTRPLKEITSHAERLSRGVFEHHLPDVLFGKNNEIGLLTGTFDSMSRSFKGVIEDIERITGAAVSGKLDLRMNTNLNTRRVSGEVDRFSLEGDFLKIAVGVNNFLNVLCSHLHAIPEAIALFNEKREMLFRNRAMDEFLLIHGLQADDPRLLEHICGEGADCVNVNANGKAADTLDLKAAAVFSPAVPSPEPFTADIALLGDCGPDNYSLRLQRTDTESPEQNSLCVMLLLSDVTQLTQAKVDAEEASRAKSDFLSRMSHELRTPLNAVIGMARIARTSIGNFVSAGSFAPAGGPVPADAEKIRGCLDQVETSAAGLLDLINDIFDFSKIESGKLSLGITDFSLSKNLNLVMSKMVPEAKKKNIVIRMDIEKISNDCVSTDSPRLGQVLINLLSNAVKYSPDGSEVLLNVCETDQKNGYSTYSFAVIDHGIGIDGEQASRLFRPFEQAEGGMSRSYGGIGLGLAICKNLAEMMGGDIEMQSKPGEGSTFTFTIRCPSRPSLEKETVAGETEVYDFTGKRCLVVDDIEINREIAVELLSYSGLSLETAENGADAVAKFKASPEGWFNIILMDMQMPVMDGCAATREIRALGRGDSKTIPVIAMTANVTDDDVKQAAASGMNAHISKPVEPEAVMKMLREMLG